MDKIISEINNLDKFNVERSFYYSNFCSILLKSKITLEVELGRKIIIHILNNWKKVPIETYELWSDLIECSGFYPYLEKLKFDLNLNNFCGELRKELHKSKYLKNKYFHEEQKLLSNILNTNKNLIVSAPTSFGKSLLIEEIVASNKYKNIVIIQPTLALLDETRKNLKKYIKNYNIIIRTSQKSSEEKGNLFLLTAERVMEYQDLPKIDFFIIDEFYKLSKKRDDERSDILNNAFHLLLSKFSPQFYLLGPNIDGISEGFAEKYNADFFKTNYSLVDNEVIDIYSEHKDKFDYPRKYKEYKENILFELLLSLKDEQTIIYCSSPSRVRELSIKFTNFLKEKKIEIKNIELSLIEWIEKNVDSKWNLINSLRLKIGIHDGALQKHITSSMIKYFNSNKINFLFCTSTIIEGVNTSAKNIVVFDKKKGPKEIDFFDYSNIKGRSGRMMVHYLGRVFDFNRPPERKGDIIVDIPFFEQNPVSDEVLINLTVDEVKNKDSLQYKDLIKIPIEERSLFKKNGVLVKGQKNILEQLRNDIKEKQNLICWTGMPKYSQLKYILDLAWDNLLKSGETTSPMTKKRVTKVTFDYGLNQNINLLIQNTYFYFKEKNIYPKLDDGGVFNEAIRESFNILKHWFEYKVPKWLNVINELQKFVCSEQGLTSGNYSFYANQIENDFIEEDFRIFLEYGIPKSAIKKIGNKVPKNLTEDQIIEFMKDSINDPKNNFIEYEKEKIRDSL